MPSFKITARQVNSKVALTIVYYINTPGLKKVSYIYCIISTSALLVPLVFSTKCQQSVIKTVGLSLSEVVTIALASESVVLYNFISPSQMVA